MNPTTPPEPTVRDAAIEALRLPGRPLPDLTAKKLDAFIAALGLDPAGSVARLREDLWLAECLRAGSADMDRAVACLALELPGAVYEDVVAKWTAVRAGRAGGAG